MKRKVLKLALLGIAVGLLGFLVAASGLVPIAASSGHWAITNWFLHFTMRQSVQLRAAGISPPPLDDPALTLRGAGHYVSGCAPCHGAPGDPRSLVTQQMTPPPPYLPDMIPRWKSQELFWIVKHGVKFTGMPAWPSQQRDDEVWAVVAFIRQLPQMRPDDYQRLAFGEQPLEASRLEPVAEHLESCIRCHGKDGAGRGEGAFPHLYLQTEEYLYGSLRAYAQGARHSGIMQAQTLDLSEDSLRALARHYASQAPAAAPTIPGDAAAVARGESIAQQGLPAQGVPPCTACHGPKDSPRSPYYPRLAGQHANYLQQQLQLLQQGARGGTPYAHIMQTIAQRLEAEQIEAVAAFYASLPPEEEANLAKRAGAEDSSASGDIVSGP